MSNHIFPPAVASGNIFTDDDLELIIKLGEAGTKENAEWKFIPTQDSIKIDEEYDVEVRKAQISFITSNNKEFDFLNAKIMAMFVKINKEHFRFDLVRLAPVQYTNYQVGDHYQQFHPDCHSGSGYLKNGILPRKISATIQLSDSDDYEGGELILMANGIPKVMTKERGAMIFFPSYILHKITPITKGNRKSLVCWTEGPQFK